MELVHAPRLYSMQHTAYTMHSHTMHSHTMHSYTMHSLCIHYALTMHTLCTHYAGTISSSVGPGSSMSEVQCVVYPQYHPF
jgi:hypothetical protein